MANVHPEMGYRGCLGIIRLADKYSHPRIEAAAELALLTGACRYRSVASILKNSLDRQPLPESLVAPPATPKAGSGASKRGLRGHYAAGGQSHITSDSRWQLWNLH
jgi:hypothetical protein